MKIDCPAAMLQRALGDDGFDLFRTERGDAESYNLTAVQTDAILRMTLGQLVNLEQEKLGNEHQELLKEIQEYLRILSDDANILAMIKDDLEELKRKYADKRRTEISGEELGDIDLEDLITEEQMVVSISHSGYIKRTPSKVYRAQRRGGKGLKGAKTEEEDPIEHLFVATTHAYLLFFTNQGKVYWQKVYDLPQLNRESRGRAIVNLLNLADNEKIADCRAIRDFDLPGHFLMMATRKGLIKKTPLEAYSRPKKGGIIAIKLRDDDELVDVVITKPGDEVVLSTATGMAIRFQESDARSMGRNTSGVKGINLEKGDHLVGMVVADPNATLLTACQNGYGKRTDFGDNAADVTGDESGSARYRTQRRGGKGLRDIKATQRNGPVIGVVSVDDSDEVLMMTARGKIQRIRAADISVIGRNTQGVRIMSLDDADTLAAVVRVPKEEGEDEEEPEVDITNAIAPAPEHDGPQESLSDEEDQTEPPSDT